jgi:O-antigen/teichoic acid export membrane protein
MNQSVSRNFAFIATSNLLAPMFSLVLVLAIGRIQGVEVLGKYSLLMSIFVFGMSAAGFGLPLVITREVAQAPCEAGRWFVNAAALSMGLAVPFLAVAALVMEIRASDGQMALALALAAFTVLPSAVTQCAEAVLLAHERARDFVLINLGETAVRAVIGTALVLGGFGIVAIASLLLALRVATALGFVLMLRWRGVPVALRLDRRVLWRLAGYVPVTGLIPVVNALYARADVFLLSSLGSWRDVGIYSAALRLVDLARTITPAYARAVYPRLARLRAAGAELYNGAADRATRDGLVLAIPIALALYGGAEPLIRLLFGQALVPAASILGILAWTVIPFALAIVLAQVLFAADRQAVDLGVNLVSMLVSVTVGVLLVPRFGAAGAAVAVLAASTVYSLLQYAGVVRWAAKLRIGPDVLRLTAATAVALVGLWASAWAGPIVATLLALGLYGVGIAVLGLVPVGELRRRLGWRAAGPPGRERVAL